MKRLSIQTVRRYLASVSPVAVSAVVVAVLAGSNLAQEVSPPPVPPTAQGQTATTRLQDRTFESDSLSRPMKYRILLPAGYFETTRNYPVLYLLHGWHGDYRNWSTLTNLTQLAETAPIIIVMPDAGDSWYTDSASVSQDRFERYIVRDLIAEIDEHWRTLRSSQHRAIAGLSMGGYGAVKFGLKYPEVFHIAASLSGAFNATLPELVELRADLQPSLARAFGSGKNKDREQNDVYQLAARADAHSTPYLYVECGNEDSTFLDPNRKLVSVLSRRRLAYEYHETPGAHTWEYWGARLPVVLSAVRRSIAEDLASSTTVDLHRPQAVRLVVPR